MSVSRVHWLARKAIASWKHRMEIIVWNMMERRYGDLFQSPDDFLAGSTQAYRYVQNELCTAENVRHLREACSESVYDAIQESSSELEQWRRENGDKAGMIFDDVQSYFDTIALPENFNSEGNVTASVAFYALVRQQSDPETVLHRIDGFSFQTEWDPVDGLGEW
eukprot:CAMPEP_0184491106 /NCGR_PEP_ID=MMETSP0113_2-20130426/19622_1 /TAXON_ID=91329 /ORGANISM="Norrisiella sphaerica, Strain BC52" /LENGTH=164 /DNA_ID=CAMNT_0026875319 /DNA_START=316 /DNA_END=807 /DNA_ORIENTATION=-